MEKTTDLYYESHITINPVFDDDRRMASTLGSAFGFRMAKLVMRKSSADDGVDHVDDSFMTGHSVNKTDIVERTSGLVAALRTNGFHVRRYKIEETVCDSRINDVLGIMLHGI